MKRPTYESMEPSLDAGVEYHLGDSIRYTPAATGVETTVMGFVNLYSDPGQIDGADPIRRRWQVKISFAAMPSGPKPQDRLTHPKLGNRPYRPGTGTIVDDGKRWLFDIQKV